MMSEETGVAIVGGGLTGLTLAHFLARAGVPHVVLEGSDRPGGVVRTGRVDGSLLEWGPQRSRLTASISALIEDLGIADEVITAPESLPLFVFHGGKLRRVPFSAADFLRSDILSARAKARVLMEPLTGGSRAGESVAEYFVRKIGSDAYEHLVGPLYGGLYGSDPADMLVDLSLGHVLREFGIERSLLLPLLATGGSIRPPAACSFREGMQTLPDALYRKHRESIRLETPAHELRSTSAGWEIRTDHGTVRAQNVVLTAPARDTARILAGVAPDAASRIARLVYNPLAVVHLRAETDLVGLGYQVSLRENLATRGVTFNDSLFGRTGVYTVYLGGAKAPEVVGWSDERIAARAVAEFRDATGFDAETLSVEREAMPAWDRSWQALRGMESLPGGLHIAANWESRPGIPGRLAQTKRLAAHLAGHDSRSAAPV
jgi:protoporphyrinogen/coproporphyrinogen III oxidase